MPDKRTLVINEPRPYLSVNGEPHVTGRRCLYDRHSFILSGIFARPSVPPTVTRMRQHRSMAGCTHDSVRAERAQPISKFDMIPERTLRIDRTPLASFSFHQYASRRWQSKSATAARTHRAPKRSDLNGYVMGSFAQARCVASRYEVKPKWYVAELTQLQLYLHFHQYSSLYLLNRVHFT